MLPLQKIMAVAAAARAGAVKANPQTKTRSRVRSKDFVIFGSGPAKMNVMAQVHQPIIAARPTKGVSHEKVSSA
jgi:hypothetical protein